MASVTIQAGYDTASITKIGNYYQEMIVRRQGNLKLLKCIFSANEEYTKLPQGTFTKIAELPIGFRPAEETYAVLPLYSADTPPVLQQVQLRLYTNGDVKAYNYYDNRASVVFLIPYF